MDTQKDTKINIDEHLLRESQGDYGIETSPGVYYFYDSRGDLVSTVRVRGDHYTIKFRGDTRTAVYNERRAFMDKLRLEEGLPILDEEEIVEVKPEPLKWV